MGRHCYNSINLNIVECKFWICPSFSVIVSRINLNIVECKLLFKFNNYQIEIEY